MVVALVVGAVLVNLPLVHGAASGVDDLAPVLVVTLVADAGLVVAALLLWRYGGRSDLEAIALEDVGRCPPGALLEQVAGEEYLVRGEVLDRSEDRIVLDLGSRTVAVRLDGPANPVGYQQSAQVRVRLLT